MKKILFVIGLITNYLVTAQDYWHNSVPTGFNVFTTTFNLIQPFNNKLYIAGDSSNGRPFLYATTTGDTTSVAVSPQVGLSAVLQGGNETGISSMIANSNYLFMGSSLSTYTAGAITPQVYRYDGSTYEMYGSINTAALTSNNVIDTPAFGYYNLYPSISNMALYSPTGSNDSIYAFLTPGTNNYDSRNVSVWKAPATLSGTTTPIWVNAANFSHGSGVTNTYDAITWNKHLYVSVNSADSGGMILRTANGSTWDTVLTAAHIQNKIGGGYASVLFSALEVYNGKLVVGLSNIDNQHSGYALWYTTDSVAATPTQAWTYLTDSTYNNILLNCSNINDMQTAGGKLWIQTYNSGGGGTPSVYYYGKVKGRDTVLLSTGGTISYQAYGSPIPSSFRLAYFNGDVYSSGTRSTIGARLNGHGGIAGTPTYIGTTWRFNMLNPTPVSFVDSVQVGAGFCAGNSIQLYNTSTNGYYAAWYMKGITMNDSEIVNNSDGPAYFYSNTPGTYSLTMVTYNGTNQSYFKDSVTQTITIYQNPTIDTLKASSYTVCQGQVDTLKTVVTGGTAPYTYQWLAQYGPNPNSIYYTGNKANAPVAIDSLPSGANPYLYFYLNVKDAHNCASSGSGNLNIYVNPADSLSGLVTDTNNVFITKGKVYLFQKKTTNVGQLDTTHIDSLTGTNGKYTFPSLYYGSYYIKAVADTNTYHNAAGTYYADSTNTYRRTAYQWDSALVIKHHTCHGGNDTGFNIKVIQVATPTGTGVITGNISQSSGYGMRLVNNHNHIMGAPLKGIDVKLGKNPGGGCAARTTSDSLGNYTFNNVNNGNYNIFVDIPNYGMDSVRAVSISPTNTASVNNNYYVDSTMVRVLPTNIIASAICAGDSFQVGTHFHKTAGVFADTLKTINLTDSLVILTLTINTLPTLTLTANNYTVCAGTAVTLTVSGAVTYTWSTNATTTSISSTPSVTTIYTVTGTGGNGCKTKLTQAITVNALPDTSVTHIGYDTLKANIPAATYQWLDCTSNYVPIAGATNQSYFPAIGSFAVVITQNNCKDTSSCHTQVVVGIKQLTNSNSQIEIYPNPNNGMFSIITNTNHAVQCNLYDITGKLVLNQTITNGKADIDGSILNEGVYNISLISSEGVINKRLVITR